MRPQILSRAVFVALTASVLSSCYVEYSFEQKKVELDTLGNEIHKVWRKDAVRAAENAEAKTAMLDETRAEFVTAIDTIAPEDQLAEIDQFLANLLTLIDDGIVPALTRKLIVVLNEAAADMALLQALATPSGPPADSFVSPDAAPNLLGYISGYPDLVAFLRLQTRILLENDGFTDDGRVTFEEPAALSDLVRVLSNALAEEPATDEEPLAVLIRDLTLVEDDAYNPPVNPLPVYAALFDDRGYPLVVTDGAGAVVFPFTDADGDGLADVDADGKFILQSGDHVAVRPFAFQGDVNEPVTRDQFGRASNGNGFVFRYVDLHRTALGFLIRQQYELSSKDTLYDMLGAFKTIMGTKQAYTDDIGGYEGYAQEHPLMDLSQAAIYAVDTPALPDMLEGISEMSRRHPEDLAKLFWAIDNMIDVLNEFPNAGMTDNQTMVYDMLPVLQEIVADPALWADVMAAFRDPINRKSGLAFATLLSYRDNDSVPVKDGPYDACFQNCKGQFPIGTPSRFDCIRSCPMGEIFDEPMDFDAPESPESRSAFQKFQHLLRDSNGLTYTMSIDEASFDGDPLPEVPPLLVLDDAAAAMIAAIAGNLYLGDYVPDSLWSSDLGSLLSFLGVDSGDVASLIETISDLFGAHMDANPTPDQITRLFNQPDIKFETDRVVLNPADPVCHDGYVMSKHLGMGLFQAEAAGVVDTIYPLAKAFSDHGREDLLVKLMVVFHDHYAGNAALYKTAAGGQSPMKAANMRSYEPALKKIFEEGELFEALNDFAIAQYETEQATGLPVTEALRQVLAKALQPGYMNRRQENFVIIDDGRTVPSASALHHLINAIDQASARLESNQEARDKLDGAVGNMAQLLVGTEREAPNPPRFKDAGSLAFTVHLTKFLADKAREKQQAGTLSTWLQQDAIDAMEEFWRSRTLTALVDLADQTLSDPNDKQVLDNFMAYLLGGVPGQVQVLVAVHQMLVKSIAKNQWLPVARFLARVIDPDREWTVGDDYQRVPMVTLGTLMLKKTLDADPDNTGIFLIHRGLDRPPYGDSPFSVVVDVIARYLSPDPSAETFATANDYGHFLTEMAAYLGDDVHGMERLYEIVGRRVKPEGEQAAAEGGGDGE